MNQSSELPLFIDHYPCYDLGVDFPYFIKILTKDGYMKKKLLVLLIAVIPTLMPNLASAMAIDVGNCCDPTLSPNFQGLCDCE